MVPTESNAVNSTNVALFIAAPEFPSVSEITIFH